MIEEFEYKERRDRLGKKLSSGSIAVIFSAETKKRSNDTDYPYRQNSNFYYLTGFKEDNAALLFIKEKKRVKTVLFVQKKDEQMELWNGKRIGKKEAKQRFCVDKVYLIDDFEERFKEIVKAKRSIYYELNQKDKKIKKITKLTKDFKLKDDVAKIIQKMRLVKSQAEILLIKESIAITAKAHERAMKFHKKGKYEYDLQAEIEHEFKKNSAYSDAYTSIIACGNNANTLHYIQNDSLLKDGELILIDAGCEHNYYASDITRVIPVNGKFTQAQKELYNMVLDTQLKIIDMVRPNVKRSELQKKAQELLTRGMIELGVLKGSFEQLLKQERYKKYYPHGIGHWMGIDVHDPAPYTDVKGREIALKEGMVLTIEPGIYIDKRDKNVPKKYRGIGIRIEDDILVTKDGYENLSYAIPKSIEEIEALA